MVTSPTRHRLPVRAPVRVPAILLLAQLPVISLGEAAANGPSVWTFVTHMVNLDEVSGY